MCTLQNTELLILTSDDWNLEYHLQQWGGKWKESLTFSSTLTFAVIPFYSDLQRLTGYLVTPKNLTKSVHEVYLISN